MTTLTITAERDKGVKPLLSTAIENEIRLLKAGIRKTERRLLEFEQAHGLTTGIFIQKYEAGEMNENLAWDEWIGESRTTALLHDKLEALQGVRIED